MDKVLHLCCSVLCACSLLGCGGSSDAASSAGSCDTGQAQSALSGTCASGFTDLLTCWMPEGNCVANIELSGDFDIVFDNGARLETIVDGTSAAGRYVNASGAQCGTFDAPAGTTAPTITTNGGESFTVDANGTVRCANGQSVELDQVQRQVIAECTTANAAVCDTPDLGSIPDIPDFNELRCAAS